MSAVCTTCYFERGVWICIEGMDDDGRSKKVVG